MSTMTAPRLLAESPATDAPRRTAALVAVAVAGAGRCDGRSGYRTRRCGLSGHHRPVSITVMLQRTREIWDEQDRHRGDRFRLFTAVYDAFTPTSALYPGSFADIAPSFLIDDVTYVDSDRRARQFFADDAGVDQLIAEHRRRATTAHWRFIHGDYRRALPVADAHVDLLISLYAGPVSQHCTRYLRAGGFLLANPSHGDAGLAGLDDRYALEAIITTRAGEYRVSRDDLDSYLIPKNPQDATGEHIRRTGRGIAYTRSAFAYVFTLRSVW